MAQRSASPASGTRRTARPRTEQPHVGVDVRELLLVVVRTVYRPTVETGTRQAEAQDGAVRAVPSFDSSIESWAVGTRAVPQHSSLDQHTTVLVNTKRDEKKCTTRSTRAVHRVFIQLCDMRVETSIEAGQGSERSVRWRRWPPHLSWMMMTSTVLRPRWAWGAPLATRTALIALLLLLSVSGLQPPQDGSRATNECAAADALQVPAAADALRMPRGNVNVASGSAVARNAQPRRIRLRRTNRPAVPGVLRRALPSSELTDDPPFDPSVQLKALGGLQWLGVVEVGVPRQEFTVTMDTGSSDLLIVGWECEEFRCLAHPSAAYRPSQCFWPCGVDKGEQPCHSVEHCPEICRFREDYGGGDAAGILGMDVLELAGLRAHNFSFGIISSLSLEGANGTWDGILGLTFGNREENRPTTLLSALHRNGMLSDRIFTFRLLDPPDDSDPFSSAADGSFTSAPDPNNDDQQSEFELGGMTMVPPALVVTWAPLVQQHTPTNGWNVALLRFTIDKFDGEASEYVWAPKVCADIAKYRPKPPPPPPPSPPYPVPAGPDLKDQLFVSTNPDQPRKPRQSTSAKLADLPDTGESSVCHAYPDTGTSLIGVPNSTWVPHPIRL